jgi:NADPH:quinone reductase-like Zn-dependent oxidoreductase
MKAVRFHQFGTPDVLQLDDAPRPVPGPGQVRVRVEATTFNPVDGNIRAGYMQGPIPVSLPHTPGLDVAGTVDELGPGVTGLAAGDHVIGFLPMTEDGAAADYVLAPADVLTAAPTSVPLADAAALPLVGLTAWQALFDHGRLTSGQRVLVNGAGGAVGRHAVRLAKGAGAQVVATASARSREAVGAAGADQVVDHTAEDVLSAVDGPVDLLLNLAPVEPQQLADMVSLVAPGGTVVSTTVWMPTPGDEARDVRAVDLYVRSDADQLAHLVELVDQGGLTIDVAREVDLTELPAVHAQALAGSLPGKVVVRVAGR